MANALGLYLNGVNPNSGYTSLGTYLYRNVLDLDEFGRSVETIGGTCPDVLIRLARASAIEDAGPDGDNWSTPIRLWEGIREFTLAELVSNGIAAAPGTVPAAGSMLSSSAVATFVAALLEDPARCCSIVFGGHGDGPETVIAQPMGVYAATTAPGGMPVSPPGPADIDLSPDALRPFELCRGLAAGGVSPRRKLGVAGFDACQNATLELAIELSDYAEFLVASEVSIPFAGWAYRDWPAEFFGTGSAEAAVRAMIGSYAFRYGSHASSPTTLVAVRLGDLAGPAAALKDLSALVLSNPAGLSQLVAARQALPTMPTSQSKKVDAIALFARLAGTATDPELGRVARAVADGIGDAIGGRFFANSRAGSELQANGLSITFPLEKSDIGPAEREAWFGNPRELEKFKMDTNWHDVIARVVLPLI